MKSSKKRGPSKTPPPYRKHRRSGQAIVTLSGQDHYLGPHGTKASKSEYDRLVGQWLANGRRALAKEEAPQISVVDLCAHYWRLCKTYYVKNGKPTDEKAGVRAAIKALKHSYGKTVADDFGPLALEAVRQQMVETGNSRRYINQNIGRIKRMFRWGVSKELIQVETYQRLQSVTGLKRGKCKATETKPILRDRLQQFADEYWLPDHVSDERGAEIILEAFKRKVAGELELLDVVDK